MCLSCNIKMQKQHYSINLQITQTSARNLSLQQMPESEVPEQVLFVIMLIFSGGTLLIILQSKFSMLANVPYTVAMFVYGMMIGFLSQFIYPEARNILAEVPPRLVFHIFLPVLIFEGSYGIKIHALTEVFDKAVLLAGPGVILNMVFLAFVMMPLFPSWSLYTALLVGSLLSATDPVAVVSLLKGLGVDKRITALVDGEAILNDGTAIIVYGIFLDSAVSGMWSMSVMELMFSIFRFTVVAYAFGTLCGVVQKFFLLRAPHGLAEACITISLTYVAYYVADAQIGTSGVLTLFFQGTYLSKNYMSVFPGSAAGHHTLIGSTWEFLVHLGNTLLFSLVGIIVVGSVTYMPYDFVRIVLVYLAMCIGRFLMINLLRPVLNRSAYKLHFSEILLLTHGGLRGGVATVLALGLYQADDFNEGEDVLKLTAGVVGLTLLINATTSAAVVDYLGLGRKPLHRHVLMNYALRFVKDEGLKTIEALKDDPSLRDTDWDIVTQLVQNAPSPYEGIQSIDEPESVMINNLLMRAFKSGVWTLRDDDTIPERCIRWLTEYISSCLAKGQLFSTAEFIRRYSFPPLWFRLLRECFAESSASVADYSSTHDELFFSALAASLEALHVVDEVKTQFVSEESESWDRVAEWLLAEKKALREELERRSSKMNGYGRVCATARAARHVLRAMEEATDDLFTRHGVTVPTICALKDTLTVLRASVAQVSATAVSTLPSGRLLEDPGALSSSRNRHEEDDLSLAVEMQQC